MYAVRKGGSGWMIYPIEDIKYISITDTHISWLCKDGKWSDEFVKQSFVGFFDSTSVINSIIEENQPFRRPKNLCNVPMNREN